MKKNYKKGFVLLETVIVAVFIVSIFTFVYISVVPLIGRYNELSNNYELEITYKLYHIRDAIYKDDNFNSIVSSQYKIVKNTDFENTDYYNSLLNTLFEDEDYQVIYIRNLETNLDSAFSNLELKSSFKEYIKNIKKTKANEDYQNFIFLRDGNKFAHLGLAVDLDDLTKYVD